MNAGLQRGACGPPTHASMSSSSCIYATRQRHVVGSATSRRRLRTSPRASTKRASHNLEQGSKLPFPDVYALEPGLESARQRRRSVRAVNNPRLRAQAERGSPADLRAARASRSGQPVLPIRLCAVIGAALCTILPTSRRNAIAVARAVVVAIHCRWRRRRRGDCYHQRSTHGFD